MFCGFVCLREAPCRTCHMWKYRGCGNPAESNQFMPSWINAGLLCFAGVYACYCTVSSGILFISPLAYHSYIQMLHYRNVHISFIFLSVSYCLKLAPSFQQCCLSSSLASCCGHLSFSLDCASYPRFLQRWPWPFVFPQCCLQLWPWPFVITQCCLQLWP